MCACLCPLLPKQTIASSVPCMSAVPFPFCSPAAAWPARHARCPRFARSVLLAVLVTLASLTSLVILTSLAQAAAHAAAQPAPGTVSQTAAAQTAVPAQVHWLELNKGLEYAEISVPGFLLVAVRINPADYDFVLCSSGEEGGIPHTLRAWAEKHDLSVAINASMYLPDGTTSTGYMRSGSYINNKRIVQRFGAFFAAQPDDPDLPRATILERDTDIWQELLSHYRVVIQNYRIISSARRILWSPGGPLYSISAVAQDGSGNILFLHSKEPVEAYSFAQHLLHLPLDIRTVMYVEGGGQAGLLVRSPKLVKMHQGRNAVDFLISGNRTVLLPNVIGARPVSAQSSSAPEAAAPAAGLGSTPAAGTAGQETEQEAGQEPVSDADPAGLRQQAAHPSEARPGP